MRVDEAVRPDPRPLREAVILAADRVVDGFPSLPRWYVSQPDLRALKDAVLALRALRAEEIKG